MPRAFVTGATGFVGINLVRELLDGGWSVTALHRSTSETGPLESLNAERVVGDIGNADDVLRAMPDAPDAVFHVAASTNMWSRRNPAQTRANVDGTRHVAAAALARRARRLVHTSSIAVYGLQPRPVDESTPHDGARSWINYLRTKAAAEVEVRRAIDRGLDAVILNPANIVGPYDTGGWVTLLRLVHEGKLPAVPVGRGSFCHVREVARAHVAAVGRGRTGENYLLGGTDATYHEMAQLASEITGQPIRARRMPAWLLGSVARLNILGAVVTRRSPLLTPEGAALASHAILCRCDRAERELGYRPAPLREMLEDCWRWMIESGLVMGTS